MDYFICYGYLFQGDLVGFLTRVCRRNPLYSLVNGLCSAASLKAADFTVIVVFGIVLR